MDRKEIFEHFGYQVTKKTGASPNGIGLWPKDSVFKRILEIPQFLKLNHARQKKFRIVLDYDPEFPTALFQYQEDFED